MVQQLLNLSPHQESQVMAPNNCNGSTIAKSTTAPGVSSNDSSTTAKPTRTKSTTSSGVSSNGPLTIEMAQQLLNLPPRQESQVMTPQQLPDLQPHQENQN